MRRTRTRFVRSSTPDGAPPLTRSSCSLLLDEHHRFVYVDFGRRGHCERVDWYGHLHRWFLDPLGVIVYTMAGGLKATFMASYLHTAIIFAVLVTFLFKVYASSDDLVGSPSKVYKALEAVSSSRETAPPSRRSKTAVQSKTTKVVLS